jgi:hypothetical protein
MQEAPDCDMSLVHDDDLVEINGLVEGRDAVSGLLVGRRHIVFMLAVTGNPQTRSNDGSPPEVQYKNT